MTNPAPKNPSELVSSSGGLPAWITDHCQFGKHGEPFLWEGSVSDDVDIAIMDLINLAADDLDAALEVCDFISACVSDSKRKKKESLNG